jgi:branched-chain amino acid aminotransferase
LKEALLLSDVVYLNGSIIDADTASISALDAGFLHGVGLFETMRAHHGKAIELSAHIARLNASAAAIGLELHLDAAVIDEAIGELLQACDLADARLRLTISTGHSANEGGERVPTVLITAAPWMPYPEELYKSGMHVIISELFQNPRSVTCGHKTISYLDRMTSLQKARLARAGESLWFTEVDKQLAEGSISNIFLVSQDGTIRTPPLMWDKFPQFRLILPGIARGLIVELTRTMGLPMQETPLNIRDVLDAREVFLTNMIMGVMPVTKVEDRVIGSGKPGELSTLLRSRLNAILEQTNEPKTQPAK